jgi:hypothetical protein
MRRLRHSAILGGPTVIFFAVLLVSQTAAAAAGDLDPSFSGNGISRFGPNGLNCCHAGVALQANGKIVIAAGYNEEAIVLRLRPNGRVDDTFGTGGITTFPFDDGTGNNFALDVAVGGGRIVVAGFGGSGMGVARSSRTARSSSRAARRTGTSPWRVFARTGRSTRRSARRVGS